MVKQSPHPHPQQSDRGGNRPRGSRFIRSNQQSFRGRKSMDQGPPTFVVPIGTYLHRSQNSFVVKCTDPSRVPKFSRGVYLENKAKIGIINEILGPVTSFYFSVDPVDGVQPDGFKPDQVFYMSPEDLLPMDRFTKKSAPSPKRTGQKSTGGRSQGDRFRGGNRQGTWNKQQGGNWKNKGVIHKK